MRRVSVILALGCLLLASPVFAQEERTWDKSAFGLGAVGPAVNAPDRKFFHVAGGFETISSTGVGFVVDMGYFSGTHHPDEGVSLISGGLMYEILLQGNFRPYGRVGVGVITDLSASKGFWNLGGGVNYWLNDRYGLKVEVRENLTGTSFRNGMLDVLVGALFRF